MKINLTDAELADFARARIAADLKELVRLAQLAGFIAPGARVRPAFDTATGTAFVGDLETRAVYALGPAHMVIGEDAEGRKVEWRDAHAPSLN